MQVFLSWSGNRSRALADALNDYLPLIIQSISPWFSPDDIDKGSRWLADLTGQLQKQSVAIVCITPESVNSPWLVFESGALSKALEASWVCPVLLDIEPADIKGPLAQFQATKLTKVDIRQLLGTLNKRLEVQLADTQIDKLHDLLWSDFENKIKSIPKPSTEIASTHRSQVDLLTEVLERIRGIERSLSEVQTTSNSSQHVVKMVNYEPARSKSIKSHSHELVSDHQSKLFEIYNSCLSRVKRTEQLLSDLPGDAIEERLNLEKILSMDRQRLNELRPLRDLFENMMKSESESK